MEKKEKDILIERYVQLQMNKEEQQDFMKIVAQDEELKKELETRILLTEAIHINSEKRFLEAIMAPTHHRRKMLYYPLAAASVIFILFLSFFFGKHKSASCDQLYLKYYERPVFEVIRGGDHTTTPEAASMNLKIGKYYRHDQTDSLIYIYKEIQSASQINQLYPTSRLYLSIALLENKQAEEALQLIASIKHGSYQETVLWIQLFGQLQLGNKAEALQILQELNQNSPTYSQKAKEIYQEIQN